MYCDACGDKINSLEKLCKKCKETKARGVCPYCHGQPDDEGCYACGSPSQDYRDMVNAEIMAEM